MGTIVEDADLEESTSLNAVSLSRV